jgi:hypothetical protein
MDGDGADRHTRRTTMMNTSTRLTWAIVNGKEQFTCGVHKGFSGGSADRAEGHLTAVHGLTRVQAQESIRLSRPGGR